MYTPKHKDMHKYKNSKSTIIRALTCEGHQTQGQMPAPSTSATQRQSWARCLRTPRDETLPACPASLGRRAPPPRDRHFPLRGSRPSRARTRRPRAGRRHRHGMAITWRHADTWVKGKGQLGRRPILFPLLLTGFSACPDLFSNLSVGLGLAGDLVAHLCLLHKRRRRTTLGPSLLRERRC